MFILVCGYLFAFRNHLNRYRSLKNEIEKLQAEHTEDVLQLQQKYKLEIDLLKDQLLESDARNESLEQEVNSKFF